MTAEGTKRIHKKTILIGCVALVLTLLLVGGLIFNAWWRDPFPRHWIWDKTVHETEEPLPKPDEILYYYQGEWRLLSEKEIDYYYQAILELLLSVETMTFLKQMCNDFAVRNSLAWSDLHFLEFRYHQRQLCTGKRFCDVPFDALLFELGGPFTFAAYKGYQYCSPREGTVSAMTPWVWDKSSAYMPLCEQIQKTACVLGE